VSGNLVAISTPGERSAATGVNGDQEDNSAHLAGAAYVFDLDVPGIAACSWYCGTGANGSSNGYAITGPPVLGGGFEVSVEGCSAGNVGALLVAYSAPLTFPSGWGEILVDITDPNGELLGMPSRLGDPALFSLFVPNDPGLFGLPFFTQAASFGGAICLHCAHECVIGN